MGPENLVTIEINHGEALPRGERREVKMLLVRIPLLTSPLWVLRDELQAEKYLNTFSEEDFRADPTFGNCQGLVSSLGLGWVDMF